MEDRTAQQNLDLMISNLDTVLIGAAIPFAVQRMLTSSEPQVAMIIGAAYFMSLLNFFHAKFNLVLVREFHEFSNEAPQLLNFMNITLHIILIGSFAFMAFFLDQPIAFIAANLVMRVCNLGMDIGFLTTLGRLNISKRTQEDLRHLNTSWFTGTSVFIIFYGVSLYLLRTQRWTNTKFAIAFLILEIIDIITDYYNNRRFYFGSIPAARVKPLMNENSRQFTQSTRLISLLDEELRPDAQKWLKDSVAVSELPYAWERVWCVEHDSTVGGFLGVRVLPWSNALLVRYLIIRDPNTWLRNAQLLIEKALSTSPRFEGYADVRAERPIGIIIELSQLQQQVFPSQRRDLTVFLEQMGFQLLESGIETQQHCLFLPGVGLSREVSSDLEKLILSSLDFLRTTSASESELSGQEKQTVQH